MGSSNEALQNPAGAEELNRTVEDLWQQASMLDGTSGWQSGNKFMSFKDGVAQLIKDYSTKAGRSWNTAMISKGEHDGEFDLFTEMLRPYPQVEGTASRMIRTHYPIGYDADSTQMDEIGHVRQGKFEADEGVLGGSSAPMAESYPNALEFLRSVTTEEPAVAA